MSLDATTAVVFSFALFPVKESTFSYYVASTLRFVGRMADAFPRSSFVAHLSDDVDAATETSIVRQAKGRCTVHRYSMLGKKAGAHWLVGAMRFRTLWEHDGPEEAVIVADIHDDIRLQKRQMRKLWTKLADTGAELAATYWVSDEPECMNGSALPRHSRGIKARVPVHCHVDGGLLIWKREGTLRSAARTGAPLDSDSESEPDLSPSPSSSAGSGAGAEPSRRSLRVALAQACVASLATDACTEAGPRADLPSQFIKFVEAVVSSASSIPRGADEMILDAYLHSCGVWQPESKDSPVVLLRHHHRMTPVAPPMPDEDEDEDGEGEGGAGAKAAKKHECRRHNVGVGSRSAGSQALYVCSERKGTVAPPARKKVRVDDKA